MNWLHKLRTKPKLVREQVAFFAAVFVTALIAVAWTATLPGHFSKINLDDAPEKEAIGAFSQFFSDAKSNAASAIKASFSKSEEASQNPPETGVSTTSTPTAPTRESVVMPDLKPETVEKVNQPKPRMVLISTTTNPTTTEANFD